MQRSPTLGAFLLLLPLACSGNEEPPPPPPTQVLVRVVDSVTGAPVARSNVLIEGDGAWRMTGDDGTVTVELETGDHTYRVHAPGHVAVPAALAPLPSLSPVAAKTTEVRVVVDPRTGAQPGGDIRGTVTKDGAPLAGVLVVATGVQAYPGYTDDAGAYVIAGINPGNYVVAAHVRAASGPSVSQVAVASSASADDVDIALVADAGVLVSGSITGGTGTSSVVLVETGTRRIVPGLETLGTLSDRYGIDGVPPNTYTLLAAYDTGSYVMDPEAIRSGGLPVVIVANADVTQDFGVKPALDGVGPVGTTTTATPLFTWAPFVGAEYYVPEVRDPSGRTVWGGFDAAGRWTLRAIATEELRYSGPPLTPGLRYRFRVFAARQDPVVSSNFELLAASPIRGTPFRVQP